MHYVSLDLPRTDCLVDITTVSQIILALPRGGYCVDAPNASLFHLQCFIQLPRAVAILPVLHSFVPVLLDLIFHPRPYPICATVPVPSNLVSVCSNHKQFYVVVWIGVGVGIEIDGIDL